MAKSTFNLHLLRRIGRCGKIYYKMFFQMEIIGSYHHWDNGTNGNYHSLRTGYILPAQNKFIIKYRQKHIMCMNANQLPEERQCISNILIQLPVFQMTQLL